jgi:hypothetical protein
MVCKSSIFFEQENNLHIYVQAAKYENKNIMHHVYAIFGRKIFCITNN